MWVGWWECYASSGGMGAMACNVGRTNSGTSSGALVGMCQTGKTTAYHGIMRIQLRVPLKPASVHHSTIILRGLKGPLYKSETLGFQSWTRFFQDFSSPGNVGTGILRK